MVLSVSQTIVSHQQTETTIIASRKKIVNSVENGSQKEAKLEMSNSSSSSEVECKRETNGTDVSGKPGGVNNNLPSMTQSMQSQGDVSSATPPPQSQYPSHFSQSQQQQQQAYLQQFQNFYSYPVANTPSDQPSTSPGPGSTGYDVHAAFHQQQAAFFDRSYGSANIPQLPLTPSSNSNTHVGMGALGVGPTSPNFAAQGIFGGATMDQMDPAIMNRGSLAAPPSPGIGLRGGYMNSTQGVPPASPALPGYGGVYQGYMNPGMGATDDRAPLSPQPTWTESSMQQQIYQQALASPQFTSVPYNVSNVPRSTNNGNEPPRSQSFEDMLPPSTMSSSDSLDQYAQYQQNMSVGNAATGSGTLFAHPQPWGFHSADLYSGGVTANPHSAHIISGTQSYSSAVASSQGHSHHSQSHHSKGSGSSGRGGYHGNQNSHAYYQHAATTPGPPIQTTTSNKGPDGANLFIFHIPNHFTNLDMYKLFCTYGNLLSVRIMVEKDTGRSRGFGFVSYDTPESAATAIKELNGFVIGNKRLKVQHKQIKTSDHNNSTPPAPVDDTPLFYSGHNEQHESESRDTKKDQGLTENAEGDTENVPVTVDNNVSDGPLNHFDAIRSALPESSG